MNPWIFWLEVAAVVVLLYFILLIIDSIWVAGTNKSKSWFQREIGDDFPYPDECWICDRTDCVNCPILKKEEKCQN